MLFRSFGDKNGSGSLWYNPNVPGASPSRTIYGQYRNLVLGDETADFTFGGVTGSYFWAISIDRNRYKQSLLPGTMTLVLDDNTIPGVNPIYLTDNSLVATSVVFSDAGRVYQLLSGSAGVIDATNNGGCH